MTLADEGGLVVLFARQGAQRTVLILGERNGALIRSTLALHPEYAATHADCIRAVLRAGAEPVSKV